MQFRRHRTTVLPREDPPALVRRRAFIALSRNPIYLADAMILAGVALWLDAASLLLVPVFMAVIQTPLHRGRGSRDARRFGPAYDDYAARVRRWL